MGVPCVTVGSAPRFLTMGDAPTPGDRRPACAETLPLPIAAHWPPRSGNAGEGGGCHESGAGQPPKTPCVST
jgi:hypothetical protein